MMRLWAPNATFTFGPGQTAAGTEQIRHGVWLTKTKPFSPEISSVSDHPAYKLRGQGEQQIAAPCTSNATSST